MNLEIFKKDNFEIRVAVDENNEPLFCLTDICRALEIQDANGVKNAIDAEFGKGGRFNLTPLKTAGGIQNFIMVTEPELYFVLMRSDKPNAKPFSMWVNNEILPAIRKHGGYLISGGARHNVPYQKHIENGYFEVTTQTFAGSTSTHQKFTTKITGKGQVALADKIVEYFKGERI